MSSEASADTAAERGALARRAGIVATGTLGSRLLGAARDAVIAASFALGATDAFFVAFTIPNALRALLAEGAVASAFVPVLSELKERDGMARARAFYAALTGTMLVVLAGVAGLGVWAAPGLVRLYAAGYVDDPEKLALTIRLARLLFPYIFFMGLAALGMGALNTLQRFAVPAFAPALLNVSMILAPLVFVPAVLSVGWPAITALAVAALVGGVLQVLAQLPSLHGVGMLLRPRLRPRDPGVRKAMRLLLPLMAGMGVYQLNVLLSRLFASFLPDGAQSFLYYSQRLVEIPQGVFALAIASASLPSLASLRNRGKHEHAREAFAYALRLSLFVAIPASTALAVLAEPTVTVLFGRGRFDAAQVTQTAHALVAMAAGVWAVAAVRSTVQMFYAYNDTRAPVICSAANLGVFVLGSLLLMAPMQHVGIALANSLAAVAQLTALLWLLRRRVGSVPLRPVLRSVGRFVVASAVMGALAWTVASLGRWERGGNDPRNLGVYVLTVLVGVGVYLAMARWMRMPELGDLQQAMRRRGRTTGR